MSIDIHLARSDFHAIFESPEPTRSKSFRPRPDNAQSESQVISTFLIP